jgi:anaerobic ribonucleoside-triphosphate reductase activating protein
MKTQTTHKLRVAGFARNSIVDGVGIRYTIFCQGCRFNCEDCHNPQTHDFNGGELVEITKIAEEIKRDPLLDGVTFSGGEPFEQIAELCALVDLLEGYNIACYTGFTFEELYDNPETHILLSKIDVLVDGRFEKDKQDLNLKFKGSTNQRTLDSKESVKRGKPIKIGI